MKKQITIFVILISVLLMGCENVDLSKVSKEDVDKVIVCNSPYIRFGSSCCLDKTNNSICDEDELNEESSSNNDETNNNIIIADSENDTEDAFIRHKEGDKIVVMVEYGDYEDKFCKSFHEQTFPLLKEKYFDTGRVDFEFNHFPLELAHPLAQKAAEAAECAREQDKFWEMHDKLFAESPNLRVIELKEYANDLGLNQKEFDECLDTGEMEEKVNLDFTYGQKNDIKGTPSFLINGKLISGAQPYVIFETAIEEALT